MTLKSIISGHCASDTLNSSTLPHHGFKFKTLIRDSLLTQDLAFYQFSNASGRSPQILDFSLYI